MLYVKALSLRVSKTALNPSRTLGGLLADHDNSFNAVRLLAACAVFISHSILMLPFGAHAEPLDGATYNLGQIAVNVFFFLSGLMLSRSYAFRPDPAAFAKARLLRIFPGLIVCGMVTAWIIGPLNTTLPIGDYFAQADTLLYPLSMPLLFNFADLPGVFEFGIEQHAINTPLWTVKYELIAYLSFAALAVLRLLPSGKVLIAVTLTLGIPLAFTTYTHLFDDVIIGSLLRFSFCFALGRLAWEYRDRLPLDPAAAGLGAIVSVPLLYTPMGAVASIVSVSYLAAVLGGIDFGRLGAFARSTDLSYGVYLYAWPIQQMLISRFASGPVQAALSCAAAAILTAGVAWLSWTLVEKPALTLKRGLSRVQPAQ